MINTGVETMMRTTLLILKRQAAEPRRIATGTPRLVEEGEDEQDEDSAGFQVIRD
jgi:hypothetical protein